MHKSKQKCDGNRNKGTGQSKRIELPQIRAGSIFWRALGNMDKIGPLVGLIIDENTPLTWLSKNHVPLQTMGPWPGPTWPYLRAGAAFYQIYN